jgi:hypothetical protein
MKADAAAKMDDVQAKIDKRTREVDADMAADDAAWAEANAADALDYAEWAVDNAQLVMLDAIDARATPTSSPRGRPPDPGPRPAGRTHHRTR